MLALTDPTWAALLPAMMVWVATWFAVERIWVRLHGRATSWSEVRTSLGTFVIVGGLQMAAVFAMTPLLRWVHPYRFATLSMDAAWHWGLACVVTDAAYYGIHRLLHETRLGWAFHAPHHSSRQLTLFEALRTSWGEMPVGVVAYGVPLVLLGVPPEIAGLAYLLVTQWQFILHTEMSWSFGPLDALIYTPAAHRVHHSTDRRACDSNYGGFFIVFDRLFGTWTPSTPTWRPEAYGWPHRVQSGFVDVVFGELIVLSRGVWARARRPLVALRWALSPW